MQVQHRSSIARMVGALGTVLLLALLQGLLSWQFVTVAGDRLGLENGSIVQLVGGLGFTLTVATVVLTWVLFCASVHTAALIVGGIGSFRDLLEDVGYNFLILLAAAVVAALLWWFQISPAVVVVGSTLDVTGEGIIKIVAVMKAIQQSAYLGFGVRVLYVVAKRYRLSTWKATMVVIAPVLLIAALRYAYQV